jgi:hypothetical protein
MNKKYIVDLTDQERGELTAVIKNLKGTSQHWKRKMGAKWERRTGSARL